PDEEVNQNAHYDYNLITNTNFITINYQLKFSGVDLNAWTNKTFRQTTRVIQDGQQKDLTSDITITSAMLVAAEDETEYTYNGSVTYNMDEDNPNFTEVIYTNFAPTADTRGNSTESTNELDALYVSENLITQTVNEIETLNLSINRYKGTVSEVVLTSPENTTD